MQGFALRQVIGNYNVQGLASYWVICDLQVFALCHTFVGSNLQGIVLPQAIGGLC